MGLWLLLSTHPRKHTPTSPPPPRCCGGSLATTSPTRRFFLADLVAACILAGVDLAFPQLLNFFTPRLLHRARPRPSWAALGLHRAALRRAVRRAHGLPVASSPSWGHVMGARMEADMRRDLFEPVPAPHLRLLRPPQHRRHDERSSPTDSVRHLGARAPRAGEPVHLHRSRSSAPSCCCSSSTGRSPPSCSAPPCCHGRATSFCAATTGSRRHLPPRTASSMAGINAAAAGLARRHPRGEVLRRRGRRARRSSARPNERVPRPPRTAPTGSWAPSTRLNSAVHGRFCTPSPSWAAATSWPRERLAVTDLAIYALYVGIFLAPVEQLINFTETVCRRATRASAASSRCWPSGPTWPPSPARPPWPRPAAARCAALWITAT